MKYGRALLLVVMLLVYACACSINASHTLGSEKSLDGKGFTLQMLPDPLLEQDSGQASIRSHVEGANTIVEVSIAGARHLRSAYFKLLYDKAVYTPISAVADGLERYGPALALNLLDEPGAVYSGQVLLHPGAANGMTGNGLLALVTFKPASGGTGATVTRHASAVPRTDASRALLSWYPLTENLVWYYTNQGDYNQNGTVGIDDLTPLGINFGASGPFEIADVKSCVDGNADNMIGITDLAPIGINFGCSATGGYYTYETLNLGLYPTTNTETTQVDDKSNMPFSYAIGNPATQRLKFDCTIVDPVANAYYWVRPIDNMHEVGTPSTICGGAAADAPDIIVGPGLTGSGTSVDPYIMESGSNCPFQVIDPADGDVTADPLTEYVIAPGATVAVDTVHKWFVFDTYALGAVIIYAIYDNRTTREVVFRVPPPFTWTNTEADSGDPALDAVGKYCSMADINGMPSIASYDVTAGIVRYAYYTTTPAPAWHSSTVDTSSTVGRVCTLMELHDRPVICYTDMSNHTLRFALGETDQPSGPADWTVYAVYLDVYPCATSMCTINGRPVIIFHDEDYFNLIYVSSNETYPDDISDWESHLITAAGDDAKPSVQAVNGVIGVAYYDNDTTDLHYCRSKTASPHSAGDWTITDVDTAGNVGYDPCLYAIDGWRPAIAYYDWTNDDVKFAQAHGASPLSAADWDISYIARSADDIGKVISMDEVQGTLCLAYANMTDGSIWFSRNKHADPLGPQDWQTWEVIPGPDLGEHISLANLFDPISGVPGIAYYDFSSGNLRATWTTDF